MESNFSTTAIICSWCCYRFFVSETRFTENTSGLYICCAVFLPVQGSLISKRLLTGQKRAFTALLGKSVADTGLVPWHKKSKILFVSSLFLQFRSWFVLFQTLHLNCTQILRKKNLIHKSNEGIFLWGLCSNDGRTEEENVLIFNFWSHSVLLLTISHRFVLCKTPLTTFVLCWHKKMLQWFFTLLSFVISLLLSTPWNPSFPYLSKPVTCLFISCLKGTRFSNQPSLTFL